eukprot:TRINITY_DN11967_c0_g1_i1.p1 TRINITY_DN11967_c0_g1~~TRINITY_DN11967_c0_g1_i1.p1  ORF type:complete len:375 (+),score=65.46 TRINITY_DN11967_c0_g1_i1:351-1475(+)
MYTISDYGEDSTLLPGFIDMHVHPAIVSDQGDHYQYAAIKMSSAKKGLVALSAVQKMLKSGWTTIRTCGDPDPFYPTFAVRDEIQRGSFVGPRIVGAAHYISTTGGGGDHALAPDRFGNCLCKGDDGLVINGPDQARIAVRNEIKNGSDWIKLLVSGAFMAGASNPNIIDFCPEELRAISEEASRKGIPIMAHAHGAAAIIAALDNGARTIEHGSFIDEEGISLMLEKNAYLVPTLYIDKWFDQHSSLDMHDKMKEMSNKYRGLHEACIRKAIKSGVAIALGTDFVGWEPAESAQEFSLYVQFGMTNMASIKSGTSVAAEALGLADLIGSIRIGLEADLVIICGDPISNIKMIESPPKAVYKSCLLYTSDAADE